MKIRKSVPQDLARIMDIYAYARSFMAGHGNPRQWGATNWPPEALIRQDIAEGSSYVCTNDAGRIIGTFFYTCGPDIEPTYREITEGAWLDDSPYGVVHRIASDGSEKGVGMFCLDWAYAQCGHLRIDTHGDNAVMQNLVKKAGFVRCGTIYVAEDHDPRLAYEKSDQTEEYTDIRTHYDLLIEEDNDPFRDPPALRKYMELWDGQAFLDLMEPDRSKTVLEIGVGTGRLAVKTAGRCRHLTGIDLSAKTIERAEENLRDCPNITLICGDFISYPFTETFDIIYSSLTMMHFKDKRQVIDKVSALLNQNGLFCLSIDKNHSERIDTGSRKIRIYPDTPEEITALAEKAGLKTKKTAETENAYLMAFMK